MQIYIQFILLILNLVYNFRTQYYKKLLIQNKLKFMNSLSPRDQQQDQYIQYEHELHQLEYQNQQIAFESNDNETEQRSSAIQDNMIDSTNFQIEHNFEYTLNERKSSNVQSQSENSLQDISGNADMSSRKMPQSSQKQIQQTPNQNKKLNHIKQVSKSIKFQQVQDRNLNLQTKVNNDYLQTQKQVQLKNSTQQISGTVQKVIVPTYTTKLEQQQTNNKNIGQVINNELKGNKKQQISPKKPNLLQQLYKQSSVKQQQTKQIVQKQSTVKQVYQKAQQNKKQSGILQSAQKQSQPQQFSIRNLFNQSKSIPTVQQIAIEQISPSQSKIKYVQELQTQMLQFHQQLNQLKNKKVSDKDKNSKVNKTFAPQVYNNDNVAGQLKIMHKICFQKKKENYQHLKHWDRKRAETMGLHRNIVEMIHSQIDKRIKASLQNFQQYINFFRQKLKQQQACINLPLINTKYALQNNSISKNIYINCSVILNCLSEQNSLKNKKIQQLILLIKNGILKQLIQQHLMQSQRQLFKIRQKVSSLKISLKKYNIQTQQKSKILANLYMQSSKHSSLKSPNDFHITQLDFLRSASQQVQIQKKFGQICYQYYQTAISQESKRSKIIKQAIINYSIGLKQAYNIELEGEEVEQMLKDQEDKLIKEFYQLENLMDQRTCLLFKRQINLKQQDQLQICHFQHYVQNFQYANFSSKMLLLKQFNASYSSIGSKQSKSREQYCLVHISVDFYIHIIFLYDKMPLYNKPDISLKITSKQLQLRQKDDYIDLIKKEQKRSSMISYFWESKNQKGYRLKFRTKDVREEFTQYVRKFLA